MVHPASIRWTMVPSSKTPILQVKRRGRAEEWTIVDRKTKTFGMSNLVKKRM